MRIGMVGPAISGGIAGHIQGLSWALAEHMDVEVVSPKQHRFGNVEWVPETLGSLRRLRDVDLLHVHDPRVAYLGRIMHKPMVVTFHGYLPLEAKANGASDRAVHFYEMLTRWAVESADAIIAVDSRIASWLKENYHAMDVTVIPNAVDADVFCPLEVRAKEHDEFPVLLCAKGFMPKNGLAIAVRALPLILQSFPDAQLTLAGFGPLREDLKRLALRLGVDANVYFPGQFLHERMPAELNFADLVLIPSVPVAGVEEATSLLALEAMACARPVVASDIGGLSELIFHGKTGWLVPAADPEALAAACIEVLQDERIRDALGVSARAWVLGTHTWNLAALDTMKVYEKVLT